MQVRELGKIGPKLRDKDWLLGPGERGCPRLRRVRLPESVAAARQSGLPRTGADKGNPTV